MNIIDAILARMKRDLAPNDGKKEYPTAFVLSYTEAKFLERYLEEARKTKPEPLPAGAKVVSVEDGVEKWETT